MERSYLSRFIVSDHILSVKATKSTLENIDYAYFVNKGGFLVKHKERQTHFLDEEAF